jgi:hypothetical protein
MSSSKLFASCMSRRVHLLQQKKTFFVGICRLIYEHEKKQQKRGERHFYEWNKTCKCFGQKKVFFFLERMHDEKNGHIWERRGGGGERERETKQQEADERNEFR